MRIASLAVAALFAAASVLPATAEQAAFIKKPKALGSKMSTVETYGGDQGGVINCRAACFNDGGWRYWQCKGSHADTMCQLRCSPPPPRGECVGF